MSERTAADAQAHYLELKALALKLEREQGYIDLFFDGLHYRLFRDSLDFPTQLFIASDGKKDYGRLIE